MSDFDYLLPALNSPRQSSIKMKLWHVKDRKVTIEISSVTSNHLRRAISLSTEHIILPPTSLVADQVAADIYRGQR